MSYLYVGFLKGRTNIVISVKLRKNNEDGFCTGNWKFITVFSSGSVESFELISHRILCDMCMRIMMIAVGMK